MNLLVLPKLCGVLRLAAALSCLLCATLAPAQTRVSTGTGFFVTADGYFVTCFHVVVGSGAVILRNLKGETWTARTVAVDRVNDLALLKVDGAKAGSFRPLPVAASGEVRRGAAIVTMGFPNVRLQGIEPKVTDGIINSFTGANNDPRVFQISSPIQPGNSGGPLVSMEGNVIGVIASKLDAAAIARQTGDIPQNVNYAIKSQYILDLLAKSPEVQAAMPPPQHGERPRVVDVVPALEDAIALVLAGPEGMLTEASRSREAVRNLPDAERGQRMKQLETEFRQLRQSLGQIELGEMALINQGRMLQLLQGSGAETRDNVQQIRKRLDELGTRKAEIVKRMNELAAEYRQLQESPS